jgi:tetratricopeptide (TPR) repeat protein
MVESCFMVEAILSVSRGVCRAPAFFGLQACLRGETSRGPWSARIAGPARARYDGAMPPHDDSGDGGPVAAPPFAQLVTTLRARPQPRRQRRRAGADADVAPATPPSIDVQLDRAEICSRSGRIDEAIDICNALRPSLVAGGDPQSIGWCDFVLSLSHLNAGRAKEAVIAGYRATAKLAPGTKLLRGLTVLASAVARTGDAAGALELLERAKQLLPLVQNPHHRCLFWINSGSTFHALGDMEQAVKHSLLAEGLLAEFEDPYLHAAVKMNLLVQRLILAVAGCHGVETPELTELLAASAAQVERLVAAGQHYSVAKGSEDIADAYIALGKHEKAREALQIGVKSADAAKAGPDRGILELRLGRIERLAGQYRRAQAHIGLALELLAESALLKELAEAHLENSLLNEERQHWRAALDSYRQSAQIRERLLVAQSDARAHALEVRLELVRARVDDV